MPTWVEVVERALLPSGALDLEPVDVLASRLRAEAEAKLGPDWSAVLGVYMAGVQAGRPETETIRRLVNAAIDGSVRGHLEGMRSRGNEQSTQSRQAGANRRRAALRAILPDLPGSVRKNPTSTWGIKTHVIPGLESHFADKGEKPPNGMTVGTLKKDLVDILRHMKTSVC